MTMLFQKKVRHEQPGAEQHDGRVGTQLAGFERVGCAVNFAHRLRDEAVEKSHQHARDNGKHNAFHRRLFSCGRQLFVGQRIEHHGHHHRRHAAASIGALPSGLAM